MKKIKKFLLRYAGNAAERENGQFDIISLGVFFLPLLVIIFSLLFSLLSNWWLIGLSILAGAWYLFLFLIGTISGNVRGAKYALENPRTGETWVEIKDGDETVWESEKIIPLQAISGNLEVKTTSEKKAPFGVPTKKREDWRRWKDTYSIIKPMSLQGATWKEMITKLQNEYKDLPSSYDTLSNILQAGNNGLLDTFPPDINNFQKTSQ